MKFILQTLSFLVALALPVSAFAATLSFDTPPGIVSAGDTVVVRAYLDSGSDTLNALDGDILFRTSTATFTIKEVSRSGSALTVWPANPVVSADGKEVTFTGGTAGGIPASRALVLSFVLHVESAGTVTVLSPSAQAYKDDGKGTVVPVTTKPLTFAVGTPKVGAPVRDEWAEIVGADTTPPEPFTFIVGHDPSVFDGKQFITFQTTDAQSGIDRYEVKEGNAAPVVSDITYVLKNQNTKESVVVYAYDKAGNMQTAEGSVEGEAHNSLSWSIAGLFLVLFLVGLVFLAQRKRHV